MGVLAASVLTLDSPPQVLAPVDVDRVAQVVSKLISNACHHGKIGEAIDVCLLQDDGGVTLHVLHVGDAIGYSYQAPHVRFTLHLPAAPTYTPARQPV